MMETNANSRFVDYTMATPMHPTRVSYTSHHCWSWVVTEAVKKRSSDAVKVPRWRELPSVTSEEVAAVKASGVSPYALFRVEEEIQNGEIDGVWCTSTVFDAFDAKDALYMRAPAGVMPDTLLLPCDATSSHPPGTDRLIDAFLSKHGGRVLLKAALGSGGNGIYFVSSSADVLAVLRGHAAAANEVDGFHEKLRALYEGRVPLWSLQERLQPVLVGGGRKSQVRMYCVFLKRARLCYLYRDAEVRLPQWNDGEEAVVADNCMEEYEVRVCGGGGAVPYNRGRIKRDTERLLLSECPELKGAESSLRDCMVKTMTGLMPHILQTADTSEAPKPGREQVAVLGADLVVVRAATGEFLARLLEVNNNPAMPQPDLHRMSISYRAHLVAFVEALLELGFAAGPVTHTRFDRVDESIYDSP